MVAKMFDVCQKRNILAVFLMWHFYEVPKAILRAWGNFLVFYWNYFSVATLFRTFFSHWRRYIDSYGRGFDPGVYLMTFLSNMVSRILGAIVRLAAIIVALFVECLALAAGFFIFALWVLLPFILILGFLTGLYLVF